MSVCSVLNHSLLEDVYAFNIHSEVFRSLSARCMQKQLLWVLVSGSPARFVYCSPGFSGQLLLPLHPPHATPMISEMYITPSSSATDFSDCKFPVCLASPGAEAVPYRLIFY